MDSQKIFDNQFSRLHPSMPVNTRIGIVGAGPSGLSAAYALAKLGYNNVTVFERCHTVGGMCESAEIEGRVYDLGGQVIAANSAPVIFHLATETGSELVEMDMHKLALIDPHTGKYRDMEVADDYVSVMSLTLKLQDEAKSSRKFGVHALSDVAADSAGDFMKLHGLKQVPRSVAYGYTASGYGYVQDMPYAYIQEFTRTSMAGKIRRFKEGYTSMWHKLGQLLPFEILCSTEVLSIKRSLCGATITIKDASGKDKVMDFDKVIISGALPFRNGRIYRSSTSSGGEREVLELNDQEKQLFSKVQTIDYYTTVLKIRGLEHMPMGFYYFGEFIDNPMTMGYPVAMQRFFADTDVFLFWSYGNAGDIKGEAVALCAAEVVKNMGGQVEEMILQRRFKYFPHVNSEDMQSGFYEKLETQLQGFQNTYYVGGLMAFELTERNSSYAMSMICRHFANDDEKPRIPYVKRLFPLISHNEATTIKELDEQPGVEFPDLPSLDSYLKFWGDHKFMKSKTIYTWINEEGQIVNRRTYGELATNATYIAHKLQTSTKPIIVPGDRVLLIYLPGLEFIDTFFGCLRAKVVPVPVLPPDPLQRGGQALVKLHNIAKSCGAVAILSTVSYHLAVRAGFVKNIMSLAKSNGTSSATWPDLPWLHTDSWIKDFTSNCYDFRANESMKDMLVESEAQPGELCFLQFTSGSTDDAKGVMITHGGLIHNVKLMRRRYRSTSRTVLVSWLPQYHDMGLVGALFTALVSGGTAILFSPMTFIKNPLLWLETISMYRATHSAGPNFAFELLVRRLELAKEMERTFDLSSLIFLMVAAEPVRQKTLKRFVEITRPFGISQLVMAPGYGLAENCVFVSCAFGENEPILIDWQGRVCCGHVNLNDSDVDIRIVDPETGNEHDDGQEGEIWISSDSAGIGYWGKEESSKKTFYNELEKYPGKKYTRTGDLGRILYGKLFISGRIKDLIIVGGRNIYSADVEKTVESSSEFLRPGCCAVIGVPEEILKTKGISVPEAFDQVGLVVIAEVKDDKPVAKEIVGQIKTKVAEEHGVSVASVQLIRPRTICKTTSGKIRRFECLKQFTEGTLSLVREPAFGKRALLRSFTTPTCKETRTPQPYYTSKAPLHAGRNKKEITEFLKGLVSEQTGIAVEKISATESLVSYGIDSIGVVRAAQKLTDFLGVPVAAVDIFTASCISDLASFSENLLIKNHSQHTASLSNPAEAELEFLQSETRVSELHHLGIVSLQFIALIYAAAMLILPAYLSISIFLNLLYSYPAPTGEALSANYLVPLLFAPLIWIMYIFFTCICIALFGKPFLQPNYALSPEISISSIESVKWWALSKAEEVAGKLLAVHLRGTIFLNWWFEMLGAQIGSSVLIDTVDITDPSLVLIGDGAVIAEGVLIQSHEVRNGILKFLPVKVGRNSYVGPYSVIQKGSILGEGSHIMPSQRTDEGKPVFRSEMADKKATSSLGGTGGSFDSFTPLYHFMGIYTVGFISSLSAAILYMLCILLSGTSPSSQHYTFMCIAGAFHWFPAILVNYAAIFSDASSDPAAFAFYIAIAYLGHGLILALLTATLTRFIIGGGNSENHLRAWLRHRLTVACHLRFAKLISGTEAFCVYLRLLGAKVGRHCSIRAINPVTEPHLLSIGDGVHLGDFSRLLPGLCSAGCSFSHGGIKICKNSVIGSQSLVLAGAVVEESVVLGALSVAPADSILQRGGVYVGSPTAVMVKNTLHALDERIEEMDADYKKIVGNLAGNLAAVTLKVNSRYFHRIGVAGRGILKMYSSLPGLPEHTIFSPGRCFPVVVRHSNSLSADDDARIDARGAAVRILPEAAAGDEPLPPLLDLTLKTGKAFYARTIADFARWLVCGLPAREKYVERAPHVRDAVWGSLRNADSYAELHYYSNACRLLRFEDGREMYAKFKLRPYDPQIGEESGEVTPKGILPPETGAIPRVENDTRPLLFLADDYRRRVNSPGGVRYVFQLQLRDVPSDEAERDTALDCTRPWDEAGFPYVDVGGIVIDGCLASEESERLEFNPFIRCREVDVVRATSSSQSASIDHGRSLVYEICQRLRNGQPLPAAWRSFLEQSDAKLDLSGCPTAAPKEKPCGGEVTLARTWYQTLWATVSQPLLQILLPYFLIGLVTWLPLKWVLFMKKAKGVPLHWSLPVFWVLSGILASLVCVMAKWVLVGSKKEGETVAIWGRGVFMDTAWQALRTVAGDFFMEMTGGSVLFVLWMKLMGSGVGLGGGGLYVDSMGALINPEMVEVGRGGAVGREAVLFGHIYEGEGGKVKFGKIRVGEGGFVGSRAVAMPGVRIEDGGNLSALSLAMKEEIVACR